MSEAKEIINLINRRYFLDKKDTDKEDEKKSAKKNSELWKNLGKYLQYYGIEIPRIAN